MKGPSPTSSVLAFLFLTAVDLCAVAQSKPEIVPGEVVVGVRPAADVPARWQGTNSTVGKTAAYIRPIHVYRIVLRQGLSIDAAITILNRRSDVLFAAPNHVVYAVSDPNDPYYVNATQWGPQKVQANLAWPMWNPAGQTILAITDTGVDYTHPDLTNKILRDGNGNVIGHNSIGYNTHSPTNDPLDPIDDHGHGTHCAGIAAAETNNGIGIAGISGWNGLPGSDTTHTKIMPVKVLNNGGSGSDTAVADGITWAADNGAKVISMSLGSSGSLPATQSAVAYAWSKGSLVVAAAGNNGSSALFYPAAYPNVLSVAATDSSDRLASFSNYGSWVLTAAPGVSIWATLPTYTADAHFGLNYGSLSGTSMACPHVSGETAFLLSQNPTLTNQQVKDLIITHFDPYTPYFSGGYISPTGGRINVYQALLAAGTPGIPNPPSNLVASPNDASVDLTWNASGGATSYNVYRGATMDGPYDILAGSTSGTTFTDTGLTNDTPYYYVVTAVDAAGESGYSNEATATPVATPAAPSNLVATKTTRNEIDLAWTDNSSNETGFVVQISTDGSYFYDYLSPVGENVTTFAATGLARRTFFWFRVRATGPAHDSAYSNVIRAKTKG